MRDPEKGVYKLNKNRGLKIEGRLLTFDFFDPVSSDKSDPRWGVNYPGQAPEKSIHNLWSRQSWLHDFLQYFTNSAFSHRAKGRNKVSMYLRQDGKPKKKSRSQSASTGPTDKHWGFAQCPMINDLANTARSRLQLQPCKFLTGTFSRVFA